MTFLPGIVQLDRTPTDVQIRLRSAESDGELGVVELVMAPASSGPPLHRHPTHGEGFYVLDGRLTFQVGDRIVTAEPGAWLFAPRNAPHTLANFENEPGRLLCVFAPAGFERRFERALAQQMDDPALAESLRELAEAERLTELLGPPLTPPNGLTR